MKHLLSISLTLLYFSFAANAQTENQPTADQILKQMLSAYETCTSYQDEGQVETIFITKARTWTDTKPFHTAFVRASNFYFEFKHRPHPQSQWQTYMVWEDKEGARSWWTIQPGVRFFDSLRMALAGATGVSGRASNNVPNLLRADLKKAGNRFFRFSDATVVREEKVQDKAAYKIEGKEFGGTPMTTWIEKQTSLLLKIYEKKTVRNSSTGEDFETEITTTYQPQINIEIPAEKFKITMPSN
ncbi:MAG TPA: hypothetical protein VFZ34_19810 [Blastocatellia bacterium]|nr:hypothetical protein [Blastocatellia bacterium]